MSKKEYLQYVLADLKESIEHEVAFDSYIDETWTHTIWLCQYPNHVNNRVRCDGGETSRYWFDKRNISAELRAIAKGFPDVDYIVFRCGNKRPQYKIIEASKYRA